MFPISSLARYQLGREPKSELCHPYLRRYETAVLMDKQLFEKHFDYVKKASTLI